MSRSLRLTLPGQPLHIVQRGNNRADTFRARSDYEFFADELANASRRAGCSIHAYVLMRNHVHLLVTPRRERAASAMMQRIGRRYVRYFNDRYSRTGTLWEGRFRSTLVDCERYFFVCSRYIEMNPVRAGVVERPDDYEWSSFLHNAEGRIDPIVTPHELYGGLAHTTKERRKAYRAMFDRSLPDVALEAIRVATKTGHVLGDATFHDCVEKALGRRIPSAGLGGDRRSPNFQRQSDT